MQELLPELAAGTHIGVGSHRFQPTAIFKLQILIQRLEVERAIAQTSLDPQLMNHCSPTITFPPALDLPNSLASPDTLPRTLSVPQCYRCPLGSGVMAAPVVTPSGLTYERCALSMSRPCTIVAIAQHSNLHGPSINGACLHCSVSMYACAIVCAMDQASAASAEVQSRQC